MEYVIEDTKTRSGTREIPMSDEVYACFQADYCERKKVKKEPMIDGRCGFLYLDKNDMPMVALHWEKILSADIARSITVFIKCRCQRLLPPHVCRHTFCSNMAKSGMNPKTLPVSYGSF